MQAQTRNEVKAFIRSFAQRLLQRFSSWTAAELRQAYPFHTLFFPNDSGLFAFKAERSIVTSMGQSLYPKLSRLVALDRFLNVHLNHTVQGSLNDAAINMLEQIVTELRTRQRQPNHTSELNDIISSRGGGQSVRQIKADLFVGDFIGGPLFIELKTPMPNLDIAAESKRKMLYFLAMMARQNVSGAKAFLAFAYNPFLTRSRYSHNFTRQVMDMEAEVLMGEEYWDNLGGRGTYQEILRIIDEVRQELH